MTQVPDARASDADRARVVQVLAAAKAGVVNLTQTLAVEWGQHGIRVNAIAPVRSTRQRRERLWPTDEIRNALLAKVPVGRFGRPDEIANACAYLVSDYADYVTGPC